MSIYRNRQCIVFVCDACGDELDTEEEIFEEARLCMKAQGWTNVLIGEPKDPEWENRCTDCKGVK